MVKPYAKTTYDGKVVDRITKAALKKAARRLGYDLTILQGSYNAGGVSASAGTHDGGGVVDLAPWDWENKVHVLRAIGFAAWHRPAISGLWGEHIHAVLIGNEQLSPDAREQVQQYYNGQNGLANHGQDDFWRPDPIPVFKLHVKTRGKRIDQALDLLRAAKDGPAVRAAQIKQAIKDLLGIKPW